jgi:hypothetical protein
LLSQSQMAPFCVSGRCPGMRNHSDCAGARSRRQLGSTMPLRSRERITSACATTNATSGSFETRSAASLRIPPSRIPASLQITGPGSCQSSHQFLSPATRRIPTGTLSAPGLPLQAVRSSKCRSSPVARRSRCQPGMRISRRKAQHRRLIASFDITCTKTGTRREWPPHPGRPFYV